jgi:hypothetical protein
MVKEAMVRRFEQRSFAKEALRIVREAERTFSPVVVSGLTDSEAEAIAMEPAAVRRQRKFLEERIAKLGDVHAILKEVMRST